MVGILPRDRPIPPLTGRHWLGVTGERGQSPPLWFGVQPVQLRRQSIQVRCHRSAGSVVRSAGAGAGAGEDRGEVTDGFGFGGGQPGREAQLVDADARGEVGEFGEQRGVGEQRRRQKVGRGLAGGRVAVVPEVRGQGVGEPGVDVGLDVPAGSPGEFVADGFVAVGLARSGSGCRARAAPGARRRGRRSAGLRAARLPGRRRPRRRRRARPGRCCRCPGRRRCPGPRRRAAG